jgi:hypothetical protein
MSPYATHAGHDLFEQALRYAGTRATVIPTLGAPAMLVGKSFRFRGLGFPFCHRATPHRLNVCDSPTVTFLTEARCGNVLHSFGRIGLPDSGRSAAFSLIARKIPVFFRYVPSDVIFHGKVYRKSLVTHLCYRCLFPRLQSSGSRSCRLRTTHQTVYGNGFALERHPLEVTA